MSKRTLRLRILHWKGYFGAFFEMHIILVSLYLHIIFEGVFPQDLIFYDARCKVDFRAYRNYIQKPQKLKHIRYIIINNYSHSFIAYKL